MLPRPIPPMKLTRRAATEIGDDPITSCRTWNQTIS
jgi:hypothetical protein